MILKIIVFIIFYLDLVYASICFAPVITNNTEDCLACNFNRFYNGTLDYRPFPTSDCKEKEITDLFLRFLVLIPGSKTTCYECSNKSIILQANIFDTFIYISERCKSHLKCVGHIYLEASSSDKPHIILYNNNSIQEFFRRLNINITIEPLRCGILSSKVPCAFDDTFYQLVLLKTSKIKVFVSGYFSMKNLIWDGSDIIFKNYTDPCFNFSKCCSSSETSNDLCNPNGKLIASASNLTSSALFTLELILDSEESLKPELIIESCSFINFYFFGESLGFKNLIKSAGIPIFNIFLFKVNFENIFFGQGIVDASFNFDSFTKEPIYSSLKNQTLETFSLFVLTKFPATNSTFCLQNTSIESYRAVIQTVTATVPSLIFNLGNSSFSNISIENLFIFNMSYQPMKGNYIFNFSPQQNISTFFSMKNIIVNYIFSFGIISLQGYTNASIINISLCNWILSGQKDVFYFENLESFRLEGIYLESVQSNYIQIPVFICVRCTKSELVNINFKFCSQLNVQLYNSISLRLNNISITDCQYRNFLFYSKNSIFILERTIFNSLLALDIINDVIFSFQSTNFNLTSIYMKKVSGEAIFDYRNSQSVFMKGLLIESISGVRAFFLITTTFYVTHIFELILQNSVLPRFAEFLNVGMFVNYTPVMEIINTTLVNLSLPSTNSDSFATFRKVDLYIRHTHFTNVKRIDIGILTPVGIITISRQGYLEMHNCSFKSVGYTFIPRSFQSNYNYPLLLISYLLKYSITYCVFESDETISLHNGFIVSGYITQGSEIINCEFKTRKKNPNFVYKALGLIVNFNLRLVNNSFSNLTCSSFQYNNPISLNGAIGIHGEESLTLLKNTKNINIHNISFQYCNCESGGALYVSNYFTVNISNLFFYNNYATSGGSLAITISFNIIAANITIIFSSANEASSILLADIYILNVTNYKEFFGEGLESGSIEISKSTVYCSNIYVFGAISGFNGGFASIYDTTLQIFNAKIDDTYAKELGGTFYVSLSSNLIVMNTLVNMSRASAGAFLMADDAILISLIDTFTENSESILNGASVYLELVLTSLIKNFSIKSSKTGKSGALYIKTSDFLSTHTISNLFCEDNIALKGSCLYYSSSGLLVTSGIRIDKCKGVPLVVKNELRIKVVMINVEAKNLFQIENLLELAGLIVDMQNFTVYNNSFNKYIIYFKFSDVFLSNFDFFNNTCSSSKDIYAIYAKQSSILIKIFRFFNLKGNMHLGLIYSEFCSLEIIGSQTEGVRAITGIMNLIESIFAAQYLLFKYNSATCIIASIRKEFTLKSCEFIDNTGTNSDEPSNLLIKNPDFIESLVILESVLSFSRLSSVAFFYHNLKKIVQTNCTFFAIDSQSFHQATWISQIEEVVLINNIYNGFVSQRGSAVQITISDALIASLSVSQSFFSNCTTINGGGGALSFLNIDKVYIANCSFQDNKAVILSNKIESFSGVGGTGLLFCFLNFNRNCTIILANNTYLNNYASMFGPLFVSNFSISQNTDVINVNNTDKYYFSNASVEFPPNVYLLLPEHDTLINKSIDLEMSDSNKKYYNIKNLSTRLEIKSGKTMNLTLIITDKNSKILTFDNKSACSIDNPLWETKLKTVIRNGFTLASQGYCVFNNLLLINLPNISKSLIIIVKIPKNLILNEEPSVLTFTINVFFKPCVRGEIVLPDFSCFLCPEGKFSTLDPMIGFNSTDISSNTQKCEICSDRAICPGGQYEFPRSSFWRPNEYSSLFMDCPIPESCEGPGNYSKTDRLGRCAVGHYGNLCYGCIDGYGKLDSNFLCEPCEETNRGAVSRFLFALIFLLFYTIGGSYIYSIKSSKNKKTGDQSYFFVYLRISLRFTQIVNIFSGLKLKFVLPFVFKIFSVSSNSISFATEDVLLNDCIIQKLVKDMDNLYAFKAIVFPFLPLIFGSLASFLWLSFIVIKNKLSIQNHTKNRTKARDKIYIRIAATFLISIFLFHPMIIRSSFNMLNCFFIEAGGESSGYFLFVYPSFSCWTPYHYKLIFIFNIPAIVIWGLCFPGLLLIILVKQRNFKILREVSKVQKNSDITVNKYNFITGNHQVANEKLNSKETVVGQIVKLSFKKSKINILHTDKGAIKNMGRILDEKKIINSDKKKTLFQTILKSNILKFLQKGYKNEYNYWECLNFFKKLIISLLINQNQIIGYNIIVLSMILILLLSIWAQFRFRPLATKNLNTIECLSSVSLLLIFVSIVMLSSNIPLLLQYIFSMIIIFHYCFFGCFILVLFGRALFLAFLLCLKKIKAVLKK